jgi:RloB-like protein
MISKGRKVRERPLRRRVATRSPRRTFLIFCEGERTEPEYINALKLLPYVRDVAAVDLRVQTRDGGSDPRNLVSMAVSARGKAIDEEAEIDEFWCVFDVEWPRSHPGLNEAVEEAGRNNVRVAVSNPCFELWLILHFQDCGGWLDSRNACRLRRRIDGSRDKGLDTARYMPLIFDAARRALLLDERHERNDTLFPQNNPSSSMHRLLDSIGLSPP